jgi:glycosyltransferase involved in cell wall biosynthesis
MDSRSAWGKRQTGRGGSRSILIIAPFLPWPADFGGALRVFHLLRGLAERHDVTLLAPATDAEFDASRELGQICDVVTVPAHTTPRQPANWRKRLVQLRTQLGGRSFTELSGYQPALEEALPGIFQSRRIDLVQYEFPAAALHRLSQPRPTIFDAHNIEYELLERVARTTNSATKRAFNTAEAIKLRALERRLWRDATLVVATSERDAEVISTATGDETLVVPNGVDLADFDFAHKPEPGHIVFVGAMRHQPNADGAAWFAREVLPLVRAKLGDIRFTIVGADPPASVQALAGDGIEVTGRVADIRPYLASAAVTVIPLHSGGGTRLKILEAFAAGVPVISTTVGAEGLDVASGEQLLLADSPEEFAAATLLVLREPIFAERLADSGRARVRERYGWEQIMPALEDAHALAIERFERNAG